MTTKVLTVRIPSPLYATLCTEASELGVPIAAHVRRVIENQHEALQLAQVRDEILAKLGERAVPADAPANTGGESPVLDEILLLARAIAAHANPQLVAQVRAKLAPRTSELGR